MQMHHSLEPSKSSLGHVPAGERWVFDQGVADVFPDMLRRSIPQYETMRQAVFDIGIRYVQRGTYVTDLGCARGDSLYPFITHFGNSVTCLGIDVSRPMLDVAERRFANEIATGLVRFAEADLGTQCPMAPTSLTLCVLTLQFTPVEYRQRILRQIYANTTPGGALILVEKILGAGKDLAEMMIEIYHAFKATNGYSQNEIERKRLALEGVLIPLTARANEDLCRAAGFDEVDCFWRWMNFAGWVAVKRA